MKDEEKRAFLDAMEEINISISSIQRTIQKLREKIYYDDYAVSEDDKEYYGGCAVGLDDCVHNVDDKKERAYCIAGQNFCTGSCKYYDNERNEHTETLEEKAWYNVKIGIDYENGKRMEYLFTIIADSSIDAAKKVQESVRMQRMSLGAKNIEVLCVWEADKEWLV